MRTLTSLLALLALPACFIAGPLDAEEGDLPVEGDVSAVSLDVETGSVEIVAGDAVSVEFTLEYRGAPPEIDAWIDGGVLHVYGDCPDNLLKCSTSFYVTVPAGADVSGELVTGDLTADEVGSVDMLLTTGSASLSTVHGDVDLELTTGDVELTDVLGDVWVDVTTGAVRGVGLAGAEASADVTTGEIVLDLLAPERVDVETTTGSIILDVPAGSYDLDLDVVTGSIHTSGVDCDGTCAASIRARAITGDISVLGH